MRACLLLGYVAQQSSEFIGTLVITLTQSLIPFVMLKFNYSIYQYVQLLYYLNFSSLSRSSLISEPPEKPRVFPEPDIVGRNRYYLGDSLGEDDWHSGRKCAC